MLDVYYTSRFKKDYKKAKRQGKNIRELQKIIVLLRQKEILPEKYRDHQLTGEYRRFRECHITPDWLLIYKIDDNKLVLSLSRLGSHSELFN